uniref:Hsp90 co-chaperone Cdc37 n=1 Tax=Hemiscolopendra marginata TaxID=943146 RepID=A0A646QEX0_9MYRI
MVDYSKWKDIEISDDEDDTHPNVDTASLFRWRHQARLERMAQQEKEKEELNKAKELHTRKKMEIKNKLREQDKPESIDLSKLEVELNELEKQETEFRKKEEDLEKREKLAPWNVDTISKEGFTKTVINAAPARKKENLTEEEKEQQQREFVKKNESAVKKYGMLRRYDDSKKFLLEHPHLACEETANYLVIWCINLEMEEKSDLMHHVAHQIICMQYILELAKQLDVDPRACISSFFTKIQVADKQYVDAFEDELRSFKQRIKNRVKVKLEQAMKEEEEKARQERLGPGGLDPVEVFESLPAEMQKCFEERDIAMLQKIIAELPEDQARYHMKRCVDSGLWIPEANKESEKVETESKAKNDMTESSS